MTTTEELSAHYLSVEQANELSRQVHEAQSVADRAQRRADRAEGALADFKAAVHRAVVEEAEARGWCSKADEWLEALGLPNRYYGLPTCPHAVLILHDGSVAMLIDADSTPWRVRDSSGSLYWWSFSAVAAVGVEYVMSEGNENDDIR
jgi:hypothetical protein